MAQSPVEAIETDDAKDYLASWDALGSMIVRGRSFSGRERHCAFLNTRGDSFATVSGATGLDLIDDGRGLAVTDWDGDGDLDLWLTHRTGPRVRFLRNDVPRPQGQSFLSLQLRGTACNRDAIGARVTAVTSSGRKLVRNVRAGESFLSQSSKLAQIGLLPDETITELSVLWPGSSEPELFPAPELGHRFAIDQGSSVVTKVEQPARRGAKLSPSTPLAAQSTDQIRILLSNRPPLAKFNYVGFDGSLKEFENGGKAGPVLVNLWASWCTPCVVELKEFSDAYEAIRAKHLRILALSTDAITEDGSKPDITAAKALVAKNGYPFEIGAIDANVVRLLTVLHNAAIPRERPLPLPSSFLIDKNGKVAVIYKGPVTVAQLLADVELIDSAPHVINAAVFPFPGKTGLDLFKLTPLDFAQAYQQGGYIGDARAYVEERIDSMRGAAAGGKPSKALIQAEYFLGTLAQSESNWEAAASAYQKVLELSPDGVAIHVPLAVALWQAGRKDEARNHFSIAAAATAENASMGLTLAKGWLQVDQPAEAIPLLEQAQKAISNSSEIPLLLATAMAEAGRSADSVSLLENCLSASPQSHDIANHLAWIYATDPDAKVRNASKALEMAQKLAKQSSSANPRILDTLAAAYANTGDFAEAERIARQARDIALANGIDTLVEKLSARIAVYQSGTAWRGE